MLNHPLLGCFIVTSLVMGHAVYAYATTNYRPFSMAPRYSLISTLGANSGMGHAPKSGQIEPMRIMQIDLDYVYDEDPEQQQRNLDALIERVKNMNISTVFLQAFADPQGTELASALYFPNRVLPVRADLFSQVVLRLKNETGVKVFGWLPVLSFDLGPLVEPVMAWDDQTDHIAVDPKAYHRASPFDPVARAKIIQIYEDMAQAPIDGLLFHDDALLSDFEDANPSAVKAYQRAGFSSVDVCLTYQSSFNEKMDGL